MQLGLAREKPARQEAEANSAQKGARENCLHTSQLVRSFNPGKLELTPITVSTATATAAASASTSRTFFTRAGFVDRQRPTLEVFLVEHGNGLGSVLGRRHFNECEAARTTGGAILHDI